MMQKTLYYWMEYVDSESSTRLDGTCKWTRMVESEMTDDIVWHEFIPTPKADAPKTLNLFSAPIIKYCVRSALSTGTSSPSAVPME